MISPKLNEFPVPPDRPRTITVPISGFLKNSYSALIFNFFQNKLLNKFKSTQKKHKKKEIEKKNEELIINQVKKLITRSKSMIWADAEMQADDKKIYTAKNLQVGIFDNLVYDFGKDPSLDSF